MRIVSSSGTSVPALRMGRSSPASGDSDFSSARNMSPVEICGSPRRSWSRRACVPFPAPGAPMRTMIFDIRGDCRMPGLSCRFQLRPGIRRLVLSSAAAQAAARPEEAFVVAHDELRLDLRDGVHGDADQDQERRAAEVELVAHPVRYPPEARRAGDELLDP